LAAAAVSISPDCSATRARASSGEKLRPKYWQIVDRLIGSA
jgi:hypothetical protein